MAARMTRMSIPSKYALRTAGVTDAAVIAHHRVAMFHDMGILHHANVSALERAARDYLDAALANREYLGWLIEAEGSVVAGGGLVIRRLLPRPESLEGGEEAYVLNVYTEPAHRRRGLACQLMEMIMVWCRERNIARISLHASDDGRRVYEQLGFVQTNEMRWTSEAQENG